MDKITLCWQKMKQNMIHVGNSKNVKEFTAWYDKNIDKSFAEGYSAWGHWKIYFNKEQWDKYNNNFDEWQFAEIGLLAFDGEYDECLVNKNMYDKYLENKS